MGLFVYLAFRSGYKSCGSEMNRRLMELRLQELVKSGGKNVDPVKSIHDEFHKLSEERVLLKKHIAITEEYLENNDIVGLRNWLSKMDAFLANESIGPK